MKQNNIEYSCYFCDKPNENETYQHFLKTVLFKAIINDKLNEIYLKYLSGENEEKNEIKFTFNEFSDFLGELNNAYVEIFANTDYFKVFL